LARILPALLATEELVFSFFTMVYSIALRFPRSCLY
jgi:hypothetical protein